MPEGSHKPSLPRLDSWLRPQFGLVIYRNDIRLSIGSNGFDSRRDRHSKERILKKLLAVLLFLGAAVLLPAQTSSPNIAFNLGAYGYGCGQLTAAYNCSGIPIVETNPDGSVTHGSLWTDLFYNGSYDFVSFGTLGNLGTAQVTNVTVSGTTVVVTFAGPLYGGTTPYTGTLTFTYKTYKGYRSGRGATYFTGWTITGGTVSIQEVGADSVTICPTC